ncbi:MAG: hypothetical protein ACK41D_05635 [Rubricoccaceae bacterium]
MRTPLLAAALALALAACGAETAPETPPDAAGTDAADGPPRAAFPDTLRPGDLLLTGLPAFQHDYRLDMLEPQRLYVGVLEVRYAPDAAAGRAVYALTNAGGPSGIIQIDSVEARYPSLAPLRHVGTGGQRTAEYRYEAGGVRGTRTPVDGETQALDVALGEPAFDGASLMLVATAMPLREGYAPVVPVFLPEEGLVHYAFRVEALADEPGAWRVEAARPGGTTTTFEVLERPRRVLRAEYVLPSGARVELSPLRDRPAR